VSKRRRKRGKLEGKGKGTGKEGKGKNRRGGHSGPPEIEHPLGMYGRDWDDDFAYIAGFTSGGAAYGVSWQEADYLRNDPDILKIMGKDEAERLWGPPGPGAPGPGAQGSEPAGRAGGDVHETDVPF
jgi:hypothetical protein